MEIKLPANIQDKKRQSEEQYCMTHTAFLDVSQIAAVENEYKYTKHLFYGGYDDAERRIMIFLPDYLDEIDDDPLIILRASIPRGGRELSHRDYLGSILALGIDRSVTGDIIVRKDGADIIILKSMAEFLLSNYNQAGHTHLKTELVPITELNLGEKHVLLKHDTVASLRLDNIVGSAYNLSRAKAQDAIGAGVVFVNNIQCTKNDKEITENDKIVLRGKGKIILDKIGSKSKKNRIFIEYQQYF